MKQIQQYQSTNSIQNHQESQNQSKRSKSLQDITQTIVWFTEKGIQKGDTQTILDSWRTIQKTEYNLNLNRFNLLIPRLTKSQATHKRLKKQLQIKLN